MPFHVGYGRKVGDHTDEENLQETDDYGRFAKGSTNPESERSADDNGSGGGNPPRREDFSSRAEWWNAFKEWRAKKPTEEPPVEEPKPEPEPEPKPTTTEEPKTKDIELLFPKRENYDKENPTEGFEVINSEKWKTKAPPYRYNCTKCGITFELYCRGYDVIAKPLFTSTIFDPMQRSKFESVHVCNENNDWYTRLVNDKFVEKYGYYPSNINVTQAFYDSTTPAFYIFKGSEDEIVRFAESLGEKPSYKKVIDIMSQNVAAAGNGSRFILIVKWQIGSRHCMNVVNIGGKPWIFDAQNGNKVLLEEADFLLASNPGSTILFRTDDKEIDPAYIDNFAEPR